MQGLQVLALVRFRVVKGFRFRDVRALGFRVFPLAWLGICAHKSEDDLSTRRQCASNEDRLKHN